MGTNAIDGLIDQQEHIEMAARSLKAISHPLRLKILCVVGDAEVCVQDIVEAVLQTRRDANRVYYRVVDPRTLQLIGMMREVFCGITATGGIKSKGG